MSNQFISTMFPANTNVVVISGGKQTIPLIAAIAIEVQKTVGMVKIFLNSVLDSYENVRFRPLFSQESS